MIMLTICIHSGIHARQSYEPGHKFLGGSCYSCQAQTAWSEAWSAVWERYFPQLNEIQPTVWTTAVFETSRGPLQKLMSFSWLTALQKLVALFSGYGGGGMRGWSSDEAVRLGLQVELHTQRSIYRFGATSASIVINMINVVELST